MYAIIGLGNPGNKYDSTRHNVGFNAIDCLAERHNVKITKIKFKSVYGEMRIGSEKVLLVKPQTYMNNSGLCVMELQKYYNIPIENIIVIYDDIDIEFAALRIRPRGSAGSHNGMKSIIYHLQDDNFPRIRIGIGSPREGQDLANFVLSGFNKEERQMVDETIERAAKAVEMLIANDVNRAMNEYNG
ncbi:aminoacyl-tRNA hydrolase [Sporosalibacterium faouarense]|uniref:aminoacyl-tRNA hydrolase n=1 Tax=Sporosalibacterium faouarense TaxID=516123 RepID=UPI00141CF185|nr:aminoacyl-tRNA hydrolase [Sporosalibacterium faouarense]MTI46482.1 aminoacyl-tRNA hydrolase [Bacillota bacterium]